MPSIEFDLTEIDQTAEELISKSQSKVFCFYGAMGSGKTTLIKAMVKILAGTDQGNSPTFGLVNEYHDLNGQSLAYHFDFYRIDSLEEALDLGLEEYFSTSSYLFIEWPMKIEPLLPAGNMKVKLSVIDENTRRIEF